MGNRAVPRFIVGRHDLQLRRVEYVTLPVLDASGRLGDPRAVLLFTNRDRAERFLRNHGRDDFVAIHLDYEHLARWIMESAREVAAVTIIDPMGDSVPREIWAFDLQELVAAIDSADPHADAVEADVFVLFA